MIKTKKHIKVFEYESLRIGEGEDMLTPLEFESLEKYHGNGTPFFKLIYKGVRFNEHVGVLQVGSTLIEVLPKADNQSNADVDKNKWQKILLGMLKAVNTLDLKTTSESSLKIKPNNILDLYFEMFVREAEFLVHTGLIKKYRRKSGNLLSLKGKLKFAQQINKNLIHKERFFVEHSVYDHKHLIHQLIFSCIHLLKQINTNWNLQSRIENLLLHFPLQFSIKAEEQHFDKIDYNRKTHPYKNALQIAKLILLRYHPDFSKGRRNVLALMFDMNVLWERFVFVSLRKHIKGEFEIKAQSRKYFWKPDNGNRVSLIPDIVIKKDGVNYVLDTKWKNLKGLKPSTDDLRQMFAYKEYFEAERVGLVYPALESKVSDGKFYKIKEQTSNNGSCGLIGIEVFENIIEWEKRIVKLIDQYCFAS